MPIKTTKPRRSTANTGWDETRFIERIVHGDYVLLVGSDVVLSLNKPDIAHAAGDSSRYLLKEVISNINDTEELNINSESILSFSHLSSIVRNVDTHILDFLETIEPEPHDVSNELRELLEKRCFNTVITTTMDPFIENIMRNIYGDDLVVMDIYSKDIGSFDFNANTQYSKPTLYYLLGKADPHDRTKRFAYTENEELEAIANKWLGAQSPIHFLKYLRSKRILSVGCKFDDWFFRFFWYMLIGDINNLMNGEVAISFNDTEVDRKLKDYLTKQKVHIESDARAFMRSIISQLNNYQEELEIQHKRRGNGVFISYAHQDESIARSLFHKMTEQGFPVWLDNIKMRTSDDYERLIKTAIDQCKIFIPIISSETTTSEDRYFKKEWKILLTLNSTGAKRKIYPILFGTEVSRIENHIPEEFKECKMFEFSNNRDVQELLNEMTEDLFYEQ